MTGKLRGPTCPRTPVPSSVSPPAVEKFGVSRHAWSVGGETVRGRPMQRMAAEAAQSYSRWGKPGGECRDVGEAESGRRDLLFSAVCKGGSDTESWMSLQAKRCREVARGDRHWPTATRSRRDSLTCPPLQTDCQGVCQVSLRLQEAIRAQRSCRPLGFCPRVPGRSTKCSVGKIGADFVRHCSPPSSVAT